MYLLFNYSANNPSRCTRWGSVDESLLRSSLHAPRRLNPDASEAERFEVRAAVPRVLSLCFIVACLRAFQGLHYTKTVQSSVILRWAHFNRYLGPLFPVVPCPSTGRDRSGECKQSTFVLFVGTRGHSRKGRLR